MPETFTGRQVIEAIIIGVFEREHASLIEGTKTMRVYVALEDGQKRLVTDYEYNADEDAIYFYAGEEADDALRGDE